MIGQVIKQGGGFFKKQGQKILDSLGWNTLTDIPEDRAASLIDIKAGQPVVLKAPDSRFVQWDFPCGQEVYVIGLFQRALGVRVEGAKRFNFIVEQIDPKR